MKGVEGVGDDRAAAEWQSVLPWSGWDADVEDKEREVGGWMPWEERGGVDQEDHTVVVLLMGH